MVSDHARPVDSKKRTGFGPHFSRWHFLDPALFDASAEWLKPTPAQSDDRINIDSFLKKRTGFGPHFCDDALHDHNAADVLINVMRQYSSPAFIRYPSKQAIVSFDAPKIFERPP